MLACGYKNYIAWHLKGLPFLKASVLQFSSRDTNSVSFLFWRKNGNSFYYLFEKEEYFRHFPSSMQILLQYLEQ